ncbi:MAG: ABC transporter permease [Deltaproteobacteria bacterium]|nr:ABC transporter permease [Deltaproteobacteria bacterium]MBW2121669.1 ABC transporter permease [Deltaproteobacteria bacterium]
MDGFTSKQRLKEFASNRTVLVYLALALFVMVAGLIMPRSLGSSSLQTIFREASLLGIVALGQGIVMLSGGLDISVGNMMFFVIVLGGNLMSRHPTMTVPIVLFCLLIGAVVGLVNGLGVAKLKISSIIMTLATSSILYGGVYIFAGGSLSGSADPTLQYIGKKMISNFMPLTGVIWLILAFMAIFVLYRTTFGRKIYATGNNPQAAWLSGINAERVTVASYVICSLTAVFAGLLLLGYLGTPTLRFTDIYTMGSIAAVVLGGIEFFQGVGSIAGTIAGAFIVRFMFTLLVMFRVPEAGRMIAEGLLIITIVAAYRLRGD